MWEVSLPTNSNHSESDPSNMCSYLISTEGVSELKLAFEPGLKFESETVCRTFHPSYVVTSNGVLLVFCQGRVGDGWDDDVKVTLMNRSRDFGQTWEGVRPILGLMNNFSHSSYLTASESGETISILTCVDLNVTKQYYGHDYVLMKAKTGIDIDTVGLETACVLCRFYSDDDGETWKNEPLTGEKSPLNKSYAGSTPVCFDAVGQVSIVKEGSHQGRYLIAGSIFVVPKGEALTNNFRNYANSGSAVIYSDDQGSSWHMDGLIADYMGNEASVASISKGKEILMVRRIKPERMLITHPPKSQFRPKFGERIFHKSTDFGRTWSEPFTKEISGVKCHGTMAKVGRRIYFSIPKGYGPDAEKDWDYGRENGTIYFSDNDGETWSQKAIEQGTYSYNTVGQLTGIYRITFYSRGNMGEAGIGYRIFTDAWLDS